MLKRYILIALFLLTGSSFAQYLTYSDLISLLNIANDDKKVDNFLVQRGFEYYSGDFEDGVKNYFYLKTIDDDFYAINVYSNPSVGYLSVAELSLKVARWNYYKQIVSGNGYKQTDSETKDDGETVIGYSNGKYDIVMQTWIGEAGKNYMIILREAIE
ncbi:MAG: hypothetical protein LC102_10220 [Ignavibacteriales bacterium]|nr:MAG: hypothetical protein F9K26_11900 [Ignavibacteriaceae bacterium]MBV6445939.1 hypothetical protein [Ignavibacteriaceae bacterium]MBW7873559.1 hypothetical protein [Ignavibacteria bacterium]MCZ2143790.1 hypothetical protein [Ignavibacteriales bacterium]OQY70028.1 MAG: hypothetical protein B6D45_11880 [Ignavibacteriales bacterium UTCHB3]